MAKAESCCKIETTQEYATLQIQIYRFYNLKAGNKPKNSMVLFEKPQQHVHEETNGIGKWSLDIIGTPPSFLPGSRRMSLPAGGEGHEGRPSTGKGKRRNSTAVPLNATFPRFVWEERLATGFGMFWIIESESIFGWFQCSMYILFYYTETKCSKVSHVHAFWYDYWLCQVVVYVTSCSPLIAIINLVIGSDSVVAYHLGIHRLRATQICSKDDSLSDLRWIGKQKRKNGQLGFECQLWWFKTCHTFTPTWRCDLISFVNLANLLFELGCNYHLDKLMCNW